MTRTYNELITLPSYEDRVEYLRTHNPLGEETFGHARWMNQRFYKSRLWKQVRRDVVLRDQGCDLALPDRPIYTKLIVHHMNPIALEDLIHGRDNLLDLNQLVCVSLETHNLIHYTNAQPSLHVLERSPNDTVPWR